MKKTEQTKEMTRPVDVDDLMFIDDFDDIIETVEKSENPVIPQKKTHTVNHSASPDHPVKLEKSAAKSGAAAKAAKAQTHKAQPKKKRRAAGGLLGFFRYLSKQEKTILAVALAAVVLFVTIGSVVLRVYGRDAAVRSFHGVGSGYASGRLIGSEGLLAVGNSAATVISEVEEEHDLEENMTEIELVAQTIKGDLKVKFVSAETGRVVTGVEFGAKITGPDGQEDTHYDKDKDGIIYLDGLKAGDYQVAFAPPKGDDEKLYRQAKGQSVYTVSVKDTITMAVVDVQDEVVDEAAAGPGGEAGDITPVESVPQDTVEWVESTRTPVGGGAASYKEINRSEINDPYQVAYGGLRMSEYVYLEDDDEDQQQNQDPVSYTITISAPNEVNVNVAVGFTVTVTATPDGEDVDKSYRVVCSEVNGGNEWEVGGDTITFDTEGTYVLKAYVRANGLASDNAVINVSNPVQSQSVKLTTASAELTVGSTMTLTTEDNVPASFVSSNSTVATVDANGLVRAIGVGEVTITASGKDGATGSSECKITVRSGIDDNATLKDKQGNIVYKQNGNTYVPASNADYKNENTKLYIRIQGDAEYRYTGWQTINGSTYYFDANGNPVTGQQVIRGVRYNFTDTGVLSMSTSNVGIDISAHQGAIDWNAVRSAGVSFAIIRCGFRGYETGRLAEDSTYRRNIQGAINAGIKVGIYVYSSAVNDVEGVEEASFAVSLARGYGLSLPIFIDVENPAGGRARNIDAGTRTAVIKAFCGTVQSAGYRAGVYSNTTWFNSMINTPELTGYTIWLAQYNDRPTYTRTKFDLWQYTSKGRIPGINTNVDMNYSYINF